MATYQVRTGADGQKILSDPLTGLSSTIATSELPGAVQPDGVTTKVDSTGIISALGGNLLLNSETWLTESGTFTAPVAGWYEALCINGGNAGAIAGHYVVAGDGGNFETRLMYLSADEDIPVTIGAGGVPNAGFIGGKTYFGEFYPEPKTRKTGGVAALPLPIPSSYDICAVGAGAGSGSWNWDVTSDPNAESLNGIWYGAGGSCRWVQVSGSLMNGTHLGKGYQGAVRLRWYDPAKAAGPSE